MSHRQLADGQGHRWDVIDEGPIEGHGSSTPDQPRHRPRFVSDDGLERSAVAPRGKDALRDAELRALLQGLAADGAGPGPDTAANRVEGYGDAP